MSTEAREAKKALRKDIKRRLADIDEADVAKQSERAQHLITSLPQYKDARRISVYLSMPTGEARTDMIVRAALASGKQVFVPYVHSISKPDATTKKRKVMDMLRLGSAKDFEGLERDAWGIPHLPADSINERENAMGGHGTSFADDGSEKAFEEDGGLDLVIVPGVAFDVERNRMGHGAGFYDSYLTRICADDKRRKPYLVGLCLPEQFLPPGQILMQDWDWKVDAVAVGDGRLLTADG